MKMMIKYDGEKDNTTGVIITWHNLQKRWQLTSVQLL